MRRIFFVIRRLSDSTRASALLGAFEDKQQLADLVENLSGSENTGIQVYIGNETPAPTMKDCSVGDRYLRIGGWHERDDRDHRSEANGL